MAYIDSLDKANVLNGHFSSVLIHYRIKIPHIYQQYMNKTSHAAMHSITISSAGVAKLLSDIKPFKVSGPDDIPTYLLTKFLFKLFFKLLYH